jgi:hypothetical protein
MATRIPLTQEDEAIFDRRHDSMDAQWAYEDAQDRDYERMLWIMRAGIRYDLAPPAVRIEG